MDLEPGNEVAELQRQYERLLAGEMIGTIPSDRPLLVEIRDAVNGEVFFIAPVIISGHDGEEVTATFNFRMA